MDNQKQELENTFEIIEEEAISKTTFLSNMSHDVRTPMNAILGYTNIALKCCREKEVRECLEKIEKSANQLLTFLNDVVDIHEIGNRREEEDTVVLELSMKVKSRKKEPQRTQNAEISSGKLKGVKTLLVEDNDLNAEIAMLQLNDLGMHIIRVDNGKEAVEAFRNQPEGTFDLILMDIMMPVMNGYEATREIRATKHRKDAAQIPIIAMTANTFNEDVQAAFSAGMNAHIAKPIIMEDVVETILRNL